MYVFLSSLPSLPFYHQRQTQTQKKLLTLTTQSRSWRYALQEAHPPNHHPWSLPFIPLPGSQTSRLVRRAVHRHHASGVVAPLDEKEKDEPELTIFGSGMGNGEPDAEKDGDGVENDVPMEPRANGNGHWKGKDRDSSREGEGSGSGGGHANGNANGKHMNGKLNPEEYQHARKRLKKAVLEYYRYVRRFAFYFSSYFRRV